VARTGARFRAAALLTVALWCGLELAVRRVDAITDDWMGWRQADTSAIARNFAAGGVDLLHPRIDWGGDGPGEVEAELQLYPALVALGLRAAGESPWPGQLLSLAAVASALALLAFALARRFGPVAAWIALVAALASRGVVVAGTSIQPDPLAFLLFTAGFLAFLRYLEAPSARTLAAWVALTALAGLVKPTTLELGVAQGVLVLARRRALLARPGLWLGWAAVLAIVAAYLLHARGLYLASGNTFGVLSGGDGKFPTLARLGEARRWAALARHAVVWGLGPAAIAAVAVLTWRRARPRAEEVALAAGALALSLVAFRYASGRFGTHYHLPHVVLGAWLVARAVAALAPRGAAAAALVALATSFAAVEYARSIRFLRALPPEPETSLGTRLAGLAAPGTLVAVRARAPRWEPDWDTANNFQDPRVFFLSRTRGWPLAADDAGADRLDAAWRAGARFYVHVNQRAPDAALARWLARHAEPVFEDDAGTIHRLAPTPAPVAAGGPAP
jgi:hypothetical protein